MESADATAPQYEIHVEMDDAFADAVHEEDLQAVAEAALLWSGLHRASLTLVITDNEQQRALNRDYRGIDAPTDVLSFAAQEEADGSPAPADMPAELAVAMNTYLGDIIIAFPYAARQAARYKNPLAAELRMLTAHGVLHLLGYDHATPAEERKMWQAQNAILARWGDSDPSQRVYADDAP